MVVFAIVMIFASIRMIKPVKEKITTDDAKLNYLGIFLQGLFIGLVAGFVGAGGGFLIIPALVLLAKMPMKLAVGTSLFIIAVKSLLGFTGDLQGSETIDWTLLSTFTGLSVVGIFIGIFLSKKIEGNKLKFAFGWFVLVMGIYILIKELFL